MKRRNFLNTALLGIPGLALPAGVQSLKTLATKNGLDDEWVTERKRLIAEAYFGKKNGVSSSKGIAVSSNPLVSNEAIKILKAGGNAADAALAASIVQSVVEPHMTTLTGVFSMLYYNAKTGKTKYVNGSCNAPLAMKKEDFGLANLSKISTTAKSVLVPGFWGGFEESHTQFGKLPLKQLKHTLFYGEKFLKAQIILPLLQMEGRFILRVKILLNPAT
jgi:gamma-glutamyltranspeptidase / glutathione hydrolase